MSHAHQRLSAFVHGHVQGVGFRWSTRSRALQLGLVGYAANLADGRVHVVAEGPRTDLDQLLAYLRGPDTPGASTPWSSDSNRHAVN